MGSVYIRSAAGLSLVYVGQSTALLRAEAPALPIFTLALSAAGFGWFHPRRNL